MWLNLNYEHTTKMGDLSLINITLLIFKILSSVLKSSSVLVGKIFGQLNLIVYQPYCIPILRRKDIESHQKD